MNKIFNESIGNYFIVEATRVTNYHFCCSAGYSHRFCSFFERLLKAMKIDFSIKVQTC